MKIKTLLLLTGILISSIVKAHTLIKEGTIKAHSITFTGKRTGSFIEVHNPKSTSNNIQAKDLKKLSDTKYKDANALTSSYLKVFTHLRIQQLLPEKNMILTFYINRSGKIKSIEYLLKNNTLITAEELESLENLLKANVTFAIPKDEDKSDDIWPVTQVVFFQKLFDMSANN